MSTNVQTIYARARAFNPRSPLSAPRPQEILARVDADQQALFTSIAALTRDRFQLSVSVTSTAAASGRVIDLATLVRPIERVLKFVLADGREVSQVDLLDLEAELAPRYYVQGTSLIEVSNDWATTHGSTVSGTLTYVYGATAIDPDGALTQAVTVPDAWCDLLVLPLVLYLAAKDPQPDQPFVERVTALLEERQQAYVSYLGNYGGVESRRFILPTPKASSGKE